MRLLGLATAFILATGLAHADQFIHKSSPHTVQVTMDRLESAIEDAGASVVARVDHSGIAGGAEMEMRPNAVIIFGNPKMGTPLMQASPSIGLDLPIKASAFEDQDGKVHVIYRDMKKLAQEHGVENAEAVDKVAGALDKLTNKAIAEN